ncbi:MAG: DUF1615 family protein, partial [Deltaproteobacteria bacterium]|nr:DUF1615 family protein [Deltaproteobacteria bacterium]
PPGAPEAAPTFGERIARLKTERDLDRLFRDVKAALTRSHPGSVAIAGALAVLAGRGDLDSLNPVTTAGSMQVKVDFARTLSPALDDAAVREQLYTRAGGVRAGTARLLGYAASYEDVVYRFADYNAGVYASRNAALQMQIAALAGVPLTRDGDLLIYAPDGSVRDVDGETLRALMALAPRLGLSERRVRADARREKSVDLEDTDTWRAVRAAFSAQTGRPAPYAQVPAVDLRSPKLSRARTTSWFASSVKQHYARCRAAG